MKAQYFLVSEHGYFGYQHSVGLLATLPTSPFALRFSNERYGFIQLRINPCLDRANAFHHIKWFFGSSVEFHERYMRFLLKLCIVRENVRECFKVCVFQNCRKQCPFSVSVSNYKTVFDHYNWTGVDTAVVPWVLHCRGLLELLQQKLLQAASLSRLQNCVFRILVIYQ